MRTKSLKALPYIEVSDVLCYKLILITSNNVENYFYFIYLYTSVLYYLIMVVQAISNFLITM